MVLPSRHSRVVLTVARQVLVASLNALAEVAPPVEQWQAAAAALLNDIAARLSAPQMPPAAAVAAQVLIVCCYTQVSGVTSLESVTDTIYAIVPR